MKLMRVLPFVFLLAVANAQDVESLMKGTVKPTPGKTPVTSSSKTTPVSPVITNPSSWDGKLLPVFRSSEDASYAVDSSCNNSKDMLSAVRDYIDRLAKSKLELEKATEELNKLIDGKGPYMEEIRNGLFCSGCGRTKSEIIARGEQFPHPGQHIVLPTTEQITAQEREYDNKVQHAITYQADLEKRYKNQQQQLDDATKILSYQLALLFNGLRQESPLLIVEFQKTQCSARTRLATWHNQLDQTKDSSKQDQLQIQIRYTDSLVQRNGLAYNRKRIRYFEQISCGISRYTDAALLVSSTLLPSQGLTKVNTQMPDEAHVPCD